MAAEILEQMARQFCARADKLSKETLKFVLAQPVYKAEYYLKDEFNEFQKKQKEFFQRCRDLGSVVLYGAGTEGLTYFGELRKQGVDVLAFIDTFKSGTFCGKPIILLGEYKERFADKAIVITPRLHKKEIKHTLECKDIHNFICFDSDSALMGIEVIIPEAEKLYLASGSEQYFSLAEMQWKEDEVFVDCGAFGGESTLDFIKCCEKRGFHYSKVFAFEPDPFNIIGAADALSQCRNITLLNVGVGDKNSIMKFEMLAAGSHIAENGTEEVHIVTLDHLLQNERVTFIKMDIEGSELAALKGAEKTIRMHRPKLAICVYHKYEDIWEIPEYIWSLYPGYQFFLRHHSKGFQETVLYGIP